MARTTKKKTEEATDGRAVRVAIWLGLAAAWVFLSLSLLSFNVADRPGHAVWPANETTQNWGGPVGAATAYTLLRFFGWAIAIPMTFGLVGLIWTGWRKRIEHPLVRGLGVMVLVVMISGLLGVISPTRGPMPGLAGGTLGFMLAEGLMLPRFHFWGAVLWLMLGASIGLILAADQLVLALPRYLWRAIVPAAAGTRAAALAAQDAALRTREAAGGMTRTTSRGFMARVLRAIRGRRVRTELVQINDLDEPVEVVVEPKPRRRVVPVPQKTIEEEIEDDESEIVEADDEIEADLEEDEEALPGAPQVFDRDKLAQKMEALNVRFSGADKSIATQEDLDDIQNAVELEGYQFPGLDLLEEPDEGFDEVLETQVREQAEGLVEALEEYRINGEVVDVETGPVITLFHVRLAPGTKVAQLNAISSDLARSLKAVNIRIVANIEGRDTVGIEVPNAAKEKVRLKELMSNRERFAKMNLPMFLGKDASGEPLIADLTKMPHMLIAGTTGSGKSVCMNTIIMSFLYTKKPNELKLVLVDPKMVEMSQFRDIPHLMCPVVTEMAKATAILEWACTKMDERYELLVEAGCRDISSYNSLDWEELKERFGVESDEEAARIPRKLPYMVFIIDELADLMMTNKEVESSIIRIAQKARAVGIHLILATQRPQANVVTGLIKGNMPCRITFKVASNIDSRVVLDQRGGELLLGQGDMLFLSPHSHKLSRAQGTLVDDLEIRRVVRFMKSIASPSFERSLVQIRSAGSDEERLAASENNSSASLAAAQEDPMFDRAVEIVLETKRGSVSLLQRRLAIGYTRASRLIDLMGIAGIIGEHKGSVAREVLISPEEWTEIKRMAGELEQDAQGSLFPETETDSEAVEESDIQDADFDDEDELEFDEDEEAVDEYEDDELDDEESDEYEEETDEYEEEVVGVEDHPKEGGSDINSKRFA